MNWLTLTNAGLSANPLKVILGSLFLRSFSYLCSHNRKYNYKKYFWSKTLTRLTWLVHTSFLPSSWNLDKNFALTGELGQAHMAKKIFPIFFHAGKWLFLLLNLWFSSKVVSKMNYKKMTSEWRNFKNIFLDHFSPSFLGHKL